MRESKIVLNQEDDKPEDIKLLLCPFCGGKAQVVLESRWMVPGAYVQCKSCKAKTRTIDTGAYIPVKGGEAVAVTLHGAASMARQEWQRRDTTSQSLGL